MTIATLNELPDHTPLRAQVAVVGTGPAGAEVAAYLSARGRNVVMLESGREAFDPAVQSLHEAIFLGRPHRKAGDGEPMHEYLPAEMRGVNRLRQFGGTSVVWTGKWRRFEPRDFRRRSWVPGSGWPISYEDIAPAYDEVCRDYGVDLPGEARPGDRFEEDAEALRKTGFKVVPFFQHERPYRAAERLRALKDVRVVTEATVVRIDLVEGSDRVSAVLCRSLGGAERRIEADHVVLAAGGLETPRLLLASNHQRPRGLGNGCDLVGRYFQDHLKINRATFKPGPAMARFATLFQTEDRPRRMACFGPPNDLQEELAVTEASLFLRPRYESALAAAVNGLLGRPAVRDGHASARLYVAKYAVEQSPNPDSRLLLSEERDILGVPRLAIDWRLTDLDRRSFAGSARALDQSLRRSGLGRLDLGPEPAEVERAMDSAHHMGATRMAAHPGEGVVDPHCALFDVPNLHIASSSVFPTGAAYSPTLTIVALARRLAKRLDSLLERPLEASLARTAR